MLRIIILGALVSTIYYSFESYEEYKDDIKKYTKKITPPNYSINNPKIVTVTKAPIPSRKSKDEEIVLIDNNIFDYVPEYFDIDNTEKLRVLDLACTPDRFGYSKEEGEKKFPHHGYPKCSIVNNQSDTYLHIDRDNNAIYMDCPDGNKGKIVTGPVDKRRIARSNELREKWHPKNYNGPVNATNIEFALGSCSEDEHAFMQASMTPIFKESIYNEAKKHMTSKPKIIFFLTLDSMSRRHSYRKIPQVIDYLNSLNSDSESNYSVFDFKLHNILGPNSVANQVPIFGGKDKFVDEFPGDQDVDRLGNTSLWSMLRKKGYVSLLGLENCDNYFPVSMGRLPDVDYSVGPFYCAVQQYSAIKFSKKFALTQRCLGGHQTHYYILNYTQTLTRMNKGVNLWLYLHLNAAHEVSGQHAETIDDDFKEFFQNFLKEFGDDNDIFIYLNADHGMRYGNWYKDIDAYTENKLPSLFIIATKSLLLQYPYSYYSLTINSQRLTSKLDLRETTLYLGGIIEKGPSSINLLNAISPKSRNCKDAGIEPWDCSCMAMIEIKNPNAELQTILNTLKDYAQEIINSASYSNPNYPLGKICKKIVLDKFMKIYHVGVDNIHEFFKLEISSSTQKGMIFQVNYFVSSDETNMPKTEFNYRAESLAYKSPIKTIVRDI